MEESKAIDIPISLLRPLRPREISKREYNRILASIKATGLIEPLIVYPEGDGYVILDGVQRFRALAELNVETVPCLVGQRREAFTGNRMVNRVSPIQENRMIERSLSELDEGTIAAALGISGISHRMKKTLLKQLHPSVSAAYDAGKVTRTCAKELTLVKPDRQKEILKAMESYNDFSLPFAKALILKTVPAQRVPGHRKRELWERGAQRRSDLLNRLADAEQKHDFYSRLYKQYTIDLLRLAVYARALLTNARVRSYLDEHHPSIVERFESVIADSKE